MFPVTQNKNLIFDTTLWLNPMGPPIPLKSKAYPSILDKHEKEAANIVIDEYQEEIVSHLSSMEHLSNIDIYLIDMQPEIQWHMRPYLLDFLIESHLSFRLKSKTLFLACNIIDRYCAKRVVFKRHYQLVGCTALWIASKYEDKKSLVPTLHELETMCRDAYNEEMFIQMESHILTTLDWVMNPPTIDDFLQFSISSTECPELSPDFTNIDRQNCPLISQISPNKTVYAITAIARYFCEVSLYHRSFLTFSASTIAIASHILTSQILMLSTKPKTTIPGMKENPDSEAQIAKCISLLLKLAPTSSPYLQSKYTDIGVITIVKNFFTTCTTSFTGSSFNVITQKTPNGKPLNNSSALSIDFKTHTKTIEYNPGTQHQYSLPTPVTPPHSERSSSFSFSSKSSLVLTPQYADSPSSSIGSPVQTSAPKRCKLNSYSKYRNSSVTSLNLKIKPLNRRYSQISDNSYYTTELKNVNTNFKNDQENINMKSKNPRTSYQRFSLSLSRDENVNCN